MSSRARITIIWALLPVVVRAPAAEGNPFASTGYYIQPSFQRNIDRTAVSMDLFSTGPDAINLGVMSTARGAIDRLRSLPSAYWVDRKTKISKSTSGEQSMEAILEDAARHEPHAPLVVFILYDLPNRDCHAKASNGEICCVTAPDGRCDYRSLQDEAAGLACDDGLNEYREEYVAPFVEMLAKF